MSTKLLDKARNPRGAGAPPATDRVAPATDKLDHAVPATSPPVAPIAGALAAAELALPEPCQTCGAIPAAGQRWCLRCGAELAFAPARRWRPAAIVAGALLVLGAIAAVGYALTGPAPHDVIVPPAPPPRTVGYAPTVTVPAPLAPKLAPLAAPAPAPIAPSAPVASHSTGQPKGAQAPSTPPSSGAAPLTDVAAQDVVQSFPPTIAPSLAPAHPEYAVDGDPITAWTTATYSDPSTAPDLGLWIDVGSRIGVRRIDLRTSTPGFTVFVYGAVTLPPGAAAPGSGPGAPGATTTPGAGSSPGTGSTAGGTTGTTTSDTTSGTTPGTTTPGGAAPGTPDALVGPGWTRVARIVSVRARGSYPLALARRRFRYYLIFVTSLPPHGNHVAIAEIQLLAP